MCWNTLTKNTEDGSLPEIQRDQSNQLILFYNGPVSEN